MLRKCVRQSQKSEIMNHSAFVPQNKRSQHFLNDSVEANKKNKMF